MNINETLNYLKRKFLFKHVRFKNFFIFLEIKNHISRLDLDKIKKSKENEKEHVSQKLRSTAKAILKESIK